MRKKLTVALAGNPNTGKTTIFNALTGTHQHVGNYPGVTVEKKTGETEYDDYDIEIIDLPGTYSLSAYSPDEVVARNSLLYDKIDVVVNVVDASNAERNLNLTAQLLELGLPMVVALNVLDLAADRGIHYNYELMAKLIGAPVVPMIGVQGEGTRELLHAVVCLHEGKAVVGSNAISACSGNCSSCAKKAGTPLKMKTVRYGDDIERKTEEIMASLDNSMLPVNIEETRKPVILRWLALKLLENDPEIIKMLQESGSGTDALKKAETARNFLAQHLGSDSEMLIVEGRFAFSRGIYKEAATVISPERQSRTDFIDKIVLNRFLGLPIFLGLMWLLFQLTFTLGSPFAEVMEKGVSLLGSYVGSLMHEGLLRSLIVDGIIGGVGGVIIFLPTILLLFLGISFLEATGYMSRAAFVTDKFMHRIGLHGKSFIPMLLGFGCSIPGIMATRTLENERDRLTTIMVVPLMSCGARLPVYTLLAAAFFSPGMAPNILFAIYITGVVLAIIMAKIFRQFVLTGPPEPFVMELPAYRLPTLNSVLMHMWERAWLYLKKAGTVILAASIIVWIIFTFPAKAPDGSEFANTHDQLIHSYASDIGRIVEPVIEPLGFDWKAGVALLAGVSAKEVIVSTMATVYSIEGDPSSGMLQTIRDHSGFTPLSAFTYMLFILIYTPCLATLAVVKRETNGWKWPIFMAFYTLALAWVISFLFYHTGLLLGF